MPWDDIARSDHARRSSRYASDLTDREWALIAPFLPSPRPIGRPRTTDLREVVNAVLYIAATGCQWRMVPKDLPPSSTVQRYFYDWRDRGLWRKISNHLVMEARELEGREASPTAGIIDIQSVKTTERRGLRLRCWQEGQGAQAAHRHRHPRADGRPGDPFGRHPGPRRRARGAAIHSHPLALAAPRLRRRRLCRTETRGSLAPHRRLDAPDRPAVRHGQGLRGAAAPMGG